jgi:hypothetical protein
MSCPWAGQICIGLSPRRSVAGSGTYAADLLSGWEGSSILLSHVGLLLVPGGYVDLESGVVCSSRG